MSKKDDIDNSKSDLLTKVKSPAHLLTLRSNSEFCGKFFNQNQMNLTSSRSDYFEESGELVYNLSGARNFDSEAFAAIMDLLMQLRAAGNDQNVFFQNNTVVREQILSQLKNEILKVSHKLTNEQLRSLEVVSSNSFDEKTLTDILKSLLESSKKKSDLNKFSNDGFKIREKARLVTLERISKNYLNVLNRSVNRKKVTNDVSQDVSYYNLIHRNESVNLYQNKASKPEKNSAEYKFRARDAASEKKQTENLKPAKETIKLQKANAVQAAGEVIFEQSRNPYADFVDKITKKSKLVFENIYPRRISEIVSNNINLINKETYSDETEKIKQDIIKLKFQKDITKKTVNVHDDQTQNVTKTRTIDKTQLLNRSFRESLSEEEKIAVSETVNLKKSGINISEKFFDKINKIELFQNSINRSKKSFESTGRTIKHITDVFDKNESFKRNFINLKFLESKNSESKITHQDVFKTEKTYLNLNGESKTSEIYNKIAENIEKNINKNIISINEKEYNEKAKIILGSKKIQILNKNKIKPVTSLKTIENSESKIINKTDVGKFVPVYIKENVSVQNETENVLLKNRLNVLSPEYIKLKSFETIGKSIFKNIVENKLKRYVQKSEDFKKEYIISHDVLLNKQLYREHLDKNYMVYKEKEHFENKAEKELPQKKPKKETQKEIKITEKIKPAPAAAVDTRAIEKNIMAKTLSKNDVVDLIESYMSSINLDSISNAVIGKVERKFEIDRRRNGIF